MPSEFFGLWQPNSHITSKTPVLRFTESKWIFLRMIKQWRLKGTSGGRHFQAPAPGRLTVILSVKLCSWHSVIVGSAQEP